MKNPWLFACLVLVGLLCILIVPLDTYHGYSDGSAQSGIAWAPFWMIDVHSQWQEGGIAVTHFERACPRGLAIHFALAFAAWVCALRLAFPEHQGARPCNRRPVTP